MEGRDSFIFYRSFYEALQDLDDANRLVIYDAICALALDDQEYQLSGLANTIFKLIKPQVSANTKKYVNGKKGGRPKGRKTSVENQVSSHKKTSGFKNEETSGFNQKKANVNVNENVNENDNVFGLSEENQKGEETDAAPSPSLTLFDSFEAELARPLSPIEYQMIVDWENEYDKQIILLALAEAVKNNARSFRYIEVILSSWKQGGVRSVEEAKAMIQHKREKPMREKDLPSWYYDTTDDSIEDVSDEEIKRLQDGLHQKIKAYEENNG